jgi:hypothetical protein
MNLGREVTLGGVSLNATTLSGGVLAGCAVEAGSISGPAPHQFTEKLAIADGLEAGGVWGGLRTIRLAGTVYGTTRGAARDKLAALESVMEPVSGGYGLIPFVYHTGLYNAELQVRPNGLQSQYLRFESGGDDAAPLAIPWSVTLLATTGAELRLQGGTQSSWEIVQWGTRLHDGFTHGALPAAPGEGSLLVCALVARHYPESPSGEHAWTLQRAGDAYDVSQYGGPGARCYVNVYTRYAEAGETAEVAAFSGIGSGIGAGLGVFLYEILDGTLISSSLATGRVYAAESLSVAGNPGGHGGMLLEVISTQRTTYAPLDTWTITSGTELVDPAVGDGNAPGLWIGEAEGSGALSVATTKDANPNLNLWGYVNVGLLVQWT